MVCLRWYCRDLWVFTRRGYKEETSSELFITIWYLNVYLNLIILDTNEAVMFKSIFLVRYWICMDINGKWSKITESLCRIFFTILVFQYVVVLWYFVMTSESCLANTAFTVASLVVQYLFIHPILNTLVFCWYCKEF